MSEPSIDSGTEVSGERRSIGRSDIRIIKKYPNRRLYDTVESRYITLADVRRLVTEKIEFVVIDKKTEEDITRSILLQVIAEQEHAGEPMMSQDFLSQVIRSYGGAMQSFVGNYLEQSLKMFQPPREPSNGTSADPFTAMANIARQNYERWLTMQSEFFRAMIAGSPNVRPRGNVMDAGTPETANAANEPAAEEKRS
jgi:polyhydroxyalkanoate synthesis repressor PhaR